MDLASMSFYVPPSGVHYPHRIRLRGPWECEPLARTQTPDAPPPPPRRLTLPCRWDEGGLAELAGRVRCRRRFGYPGRIDPHERVWLTFAGADAVALVWLNRQFLGRHDGACDPFELDVTALLRERNELVVEVEAPAGKGGWWGEAVLEIRCTAFVRGVRLWATGTAEAARLHVAGEVAGTCERPLDLYVLLDNATVAYTTVEADPAGRPFQLIAEGLPRKPPPPGAAGSPGPQEVRVELVHGASVWYAVVRPFPFSDEPPEAAGREE
jgi:hypothetical protein